MKVFFFALPLLCLPLSASAADVYEIDPAHTSVLFKVRHMGIANVYGMFNDVSGKVTIDPAKPEGGSVDITIKTESVDTRVEQRDKHLRSPDFFNAKQFPTITFKSKSVKPVDAKTMTVVGDVTVKGVTKPVTATVTYGGTTKDQKGNPLVGYEATFTINRNDFGVSFLPDIIGPEVQMIVALEAKKK